MAVDLSVTNTHNVVITPFVELLKKLLESASYSGRWQCFVKQHTRLNGNCRFRVVRCDGRGIKVRLKPGDNGTAWDWEIFPPMHYDAGKVAEDLRRFDGWDGRAERIEIETTHLEQPEHRMDLSNRIASLEKSAKAYEDGMERVQKMRDEYARLLDQASKLEEEANELESSLARDTDGKAAKETLRALQKLFM